MREVFNLFSFDSVVQVKHRGVPRGGGGGNGGGRRPLFEMLTYNFLLKIAFYSEIIVL